MSCIYTLRGNALSLCLEISSGAENPVRKTLLSSSNVAHSSQTLTFAERVAFPGVLPTETNTIEALPQEPVIVEALMFAAVHGT